MPLLPPLVSPEELRDALGDERSSRASAIVAAVAR